MKRILFLLWGLLVFCQVEAQNRKIAFEKSTLQEALNKASSVGKLVFVDCYTEYCGPCKTMDALVFTLDSVADFFNSKMCIRDRLHTLCPYTGNRPDVRNTPR